MDIEVPKLHVGTWVWIIIWVQTTMSLAQSPATKRCHKKAARKSANRASECGTAYGYSHRPGLHLDQGGSLAWCGLSICKTE